MLRTVLIVLSCLLLNMLISCVDDPVKSENISNSITVQMIDLATNKPIANQIVGVYSALASPTLESGANRLYLDVLEPDSNGLNMSCSPNPFYTNTNLEFSLATRSTITITINDLINDTLVKEICKSQYCNQGRCVYSLGLDSLDSQMFKVKLFINDILKDSLNILKATDYFVLLKGQQVISYHTPYMTLSTDNNGNAIVDMSKFRYIGQRIIHTDMIGNNLGILEVINGFQLFVPIDSGGVSRTAERTIRVSDCQNNKYIWKVDNN